LRLFQEQYRVQIKAAIGPNPLATTLLTLPIRQRYDGMGFVRTIGPNQLEYVRTNHGGSRGWAQLQGQMQWNPELRIGL